MGNKHTPGPWKIEYDQTEINKGHIQIVVNNPEQGYKHITQDFNGKGIIEKEANAKLIAAAPELLEALQEVIKNAPDQFHIPTWDKVLSAIKKAIE